MPKELESWPRPRFTPGGGDALLFYIVFGSFDLTKPLSKSKYRASGMPEWLELVRCDRAKQPEVFTQYQGGKVWEAFKRDSPVMTKEAEQTPQCVILRAQVPDPPSLDYFRDVIGIVTWLLDAGGVSLSDPQMLWLWSADEWREEAFDPGELNADRHTTIMLSDEADGTNWYHTRGMRKFGRPDLSVHGVGLKHADAVTLLIERFIEFESLGGLIAEGEEIRMKNLPPGGVCRHGGDLEDPDFNNKHVSLVWPQGTLS
jgi:hypothetical protein